MKGNIRVRHFFGAILLLLALVCAGSAVPARAAESQTQSNAALVRRAFTDVLSGGNPAALPEIFSADFRHFDGGTPGVALGGQGFALRLALYRQAMPDLRFQIDDLTAVENRVITRWRAGGRQTGGFQLYPPSGASVQWTGITIWQVEEGRITGAWSQQDDLGLARQLAGSDGQVLGWGPSYYR